MKQKSQKLQDPTMEVSSSRPVWNFSSYILSDGAPGASLPEMELQEPSMIFSQIMNHKFSMFAVKFELSQGTRHTQFYTEIRVTAAWILCNSVLRVRITPA